MVNERSCAPTEKQRQEEQHGHALSPQRQGPQQLADGQEQDGYPERCFIQCACNGNDKGGNGDEQQDG